VLKSRKTAAILNLFFARQNTSTQPQVPILLKLKEDELYNLVGGGVDWEPEITYLRKITYISFKMFITIGI
jgi:hypothetical protein